MRVGLTFDVRTAHTEKPDLPSDFYGEFMTEEEVIALQEALTLIGHEVVKVGNIHDLLLFLTDGNTVDFVFNMAEGKQGRSREAWTPTILEIFQIPYVFSDPTTLCLCLDKSLAKRVWQSHGLPTPDFQVISSLRELTTLTLPQFPLFVKPCYEGTSKGITKEAIVRSWEELHAQVEHLISEYKQPVLIEIYLSGREFTVGVLGNYPNAQVLGAAEVVVVSADSTAEQIYGFVEKEHCERLVEYRKVKDEHLLHRLSELAVLAYETVNCREAGRVDIRADATGHLQLLEVNPLPGLHPTHSDLPIIATNEGLTYKHLIEKIVSHFTQRMNGFPNQAS